ncbi:glycosyltransferase [Salegentibacter sp. LM13S]|uniref:glycosyltransferase n=1 Tax=Salegentibacter lacus TaxID=2873599 RepID=UPI001CCC0F88|nr:glycosyltransferase [Salegentibacter lacus]MBZ9631484.1 glycosyltransferase [Salegentibacter lacus]
MKILHLIQKPQHRGAETFTCQLAKHQKDLGLQVKIASIFKGDANLNWEDEIINLGGNPNSRFIDYKAWRNLNQLIKDFKPDFIQANAGDTLKYAVFSKNIFGWKTPIVFRNASEVGRYLKSSLQKKLNLYLYKNIAGVASVSQASKTDLLSHFPFLKDKTRVIPIGLEEKELHNSFEFKPNLFKHIVHVGGFSFEKNHKGLLNIFKIINSNKKNVKLHLIGDGPLREEIEILVKNEGLTNEVKFYGFVNNPLDYISAADVLVLPSIIEGLPGVLLEAMYCRTPVVAYDVGGIKEIVDEKTGALIKQGDESAFALALTKSIEEPNLEQIQNAYNYVTREFVNFKIAERFVELYTKILLK